MEQHDFSKRVPSSHVRFKGRVGGLASKGKGCSKGGRTFWGRRELVYRRGNMRDKDGLKFRWLGLAYQLGRQVRSDDPVGTAVPKHLI